MKVFRDIFAAVMIGIIGGLAVSVFSYYQEHKEGGITQTASAVLRSFDTVAKAYSGDNVNTLNEEVENVFERIEEGDDTVLQGSGLAAALTGINSGNSSFDGDVIAIDGENDDLESSEPYDGILRFHVRANSDTKEDQALKMAVKEDVVTMLKPLLENCDNVDDSKNIIVANLQNIYTTAVNTIVEQGYDYDVKVYVTEEEFPAKTYGDLTFPAGNYQALRIDIGEAQGQNWWCVMFPPLCFIDESTVVISEGGKEALKRALTSEEYEALYAYYSGAGDESEVTIKGESWIANLWNEKKN